MCIGWEAAILNQYMCTYVVVVCYTCRNKHACNIRVPVGTSGCGMATPTTYVCMFSTPKPRICEYL